MRRLGSDLAIILGVYNGKHSRVAWLSALLQAAALAVSAQPGTSQIGVTQSAKYTHCRLRLPETLSNEGETGESGV